MSAQAILDGGVAQITALRKRQSEGKTHVIVPWSVLLDLHPQLAELRQFSATAVDQKTKNGLASRYWEEFAL